MNRKTEFDTVKRFIGEDRARPPHPPIPHIAHILQSLDFTQAEIMMCWLQQWRRNQFSSARKTIKRDNNKKKPSSTGLLWMHIERALRSALERERERPETTSSRIIGGRREEEENQNNNKLKDLFLFIFCECRTKKGWECEWARAGGNERAATWNKNWKDDEEKK